MFQFEHPAFRGQPIKPNAFRPDQRAVSFRLFNFSSSDLKLWSPLFNPGVRITPMPFGGERNVRQSRCIFGPGFFDLHGIREHPIRGASFAQRELCRKMTRAFSNLRARCLTRGLEGPGLRFERRLSGRAHK